jgi:hypothetical protein
MHRSPTRMRVHFLLAPGVYVATTQSPASNCTLCRGCGDFVISRVCTWVWPTVAVKRIGRVCLMPYPPSKLGANIGEGS